MLKFETQPAGQVEGGFVLPVSAIAMLAALLSEARAAQSYETSGRRTEGRHAR